MKLKAIKNKIIVKLLKNKEFTKVGIFLTATGKDALTKALVLAVGPDTQDVQVGDTILPNWNAAEETKFEKETYFIISEDEVVGIFDGEVNDETDYADESEPGKQDMMEDFLLKLRHDNGSIRTKV